MQPADMAPLAPSAADAELTRLDEMLGAALAAASP